MRDWEIDNVIPYVWSYEIWSFSNQPKKISFLYLTHDEISTTLCFGWGTGEFHQPTSHKIVLTCFFWYCWRRYSQFGINYSRNVKTAKRHHFTITTFSTKLFQSHANDLWIRNCSFSRRKRVIIIISILLFKKLKRWEMS